MRVADCGMGPTEDCLRIYLAGRIAIETTGRLLDESALPGPQARLVFAYLVCERHRRVDRAELAEALWPAALPASWEGSLKAIVSRLRSALSQAGLDGVIQASIGCYQLILPHDTWVDVESAVEIQHECDACMRRGDYATAFGWQGAATAIARRPFLPGTDAPWIDRVRAELRDVLLRSLEAGAMLHLRLNEPEVALSLATQAVALEPFRETAHRLVMRAHLAEGNRAQALRAYEHCRTLLAEELGVDPGAETQKLHAQLLDVGA